jgi:DNA polymerase I
VGGWTVVDSDESARELLAKLSKLEGPYGIDTEVIVDLDRSPVGNGRIVCWSLAWIDPDARYHPRGMPIASRAFIWAEHLETFRGWLEDPAVHKVGHNVFTFDRHMFANHGIALNGIVGDTLRMSRFLNADSGSEHGLKSLMQRCMGYVPVGEYKDILGRCKHSEVEELHERTTWRKVDDQRVPTVEGGPHQRIFATKEIMPLDRVRIDYPWLLVTLYDYASLDAKATLELFWFFRALLKQRPAKRLGGTVEGTMWDLYESWWNPGLLQLTEYERAGYDLDVTACHSIAGLIEADLKPLDALVEGWAPGVNWRSSKQLQEFLYVHKRFKVPPYCGSKLEAAKRTPKGKRPGDFVALTYLADLPSTGPEDKAGLRAALQRKRLQDELKRALSMPGYKGPDGRLHTVLAPEADTGRLSSKTPNLQNIPKADRYKLRKAFVAPEGYSLIVADYSQLELYVAAHFMKVICHDDTMERMLAGGDMHSAMALRAWPGELRGLTPEQVRAHPRRDHAKAVGYGLFYGKSASGMGISIRGSDGEPIGTDKAQAILDAYHAAVPALAKLQAHFIEYGREHWGIHTLLGRFRPVADIHSEDQWRRGEAERQLLNTPIQGSAHDIVATAMLRANTIRLPCLTSRGYFHEELAELGAVGVLQVHDELQWRVPESGAIRAAALVGQVMENPFPPGVFSVRLKADVHIGPSWGACK